MLTAAGSAPRSPPGCGRLHGEDAMCLVIDLCEVWPDRKPLVTISLEPASGEETINKIQKGSCSIDEIAKHVVLTTKRDMHLSGIGLLVWGAGFLLASLHLHLRTQLRSQCAEFWGTLRLPGTNCDIKLCLLCVSDV